MGSEGRYEAGWVYKYEPESSWCRDGYAIAEQWSNGVVVLLDTYWHTANDPIDPATPVQPLFDMADYEAVPQWKWREYAETDRQLLPRQHGHCTVYLTRRGAEPDLSMQLRVARADVEEARGRVESAQFGLRMVEDRLREVEARVSASADDASEPAS